MQAWSIHSMLPDFVCVCVCWGDEAQEFAQMHVCALGAHTQDQKLPDLCLSCKRGQGRSMLDTIPVHAHLIQSVC